MKGQEAYAQYKDEKYALVAVVCFGAFCMRGFGKRI